MRKRLLLAALVAAVLLGGFMLKNTNSNSGVLRVAFPYAKPSSVYEPARIHLAPEYIFLENVFSPLVEVNPKTGEVEAGVAETPYWKGTELHLVIRKDLKTVTGRPVTASDAEFSLKRLLIMPGNTHGDFQDLICGSQQLKTIEDSCDGIRVEGNELILKTTEAGKTFLVGMLTAIDFAVIPKASVDPVTLKIIDFKNTSGPYYVSRDSESGLIQLTANKNHYHYSDKIPQVIELIPSNPANPHSSLDDYRDNKVDFITTIDAARADDVIAFSRTQSDAVLHTSMNIRSFVLTFSTRGLKEIPAKDRFRIGKKLRDSFWKTFDGVDGYEKSRQFFPAFSDGALDKDKITQIDSLFDVTGDVETKNLKMTLVRLGDTTKFVNAIKAVLPDIDVKEAAKSPDFLKYNDASEMPHMVLSGPDTGFIEDIGLISYSLNAGYFGLTRDERKQWLSRYMAMPNKADRLAMLNVLSESSLDQPIIVPLLVAPYAAIARKQWKIGLSQFYANNPLWLIQAN